MIPRPIKLLSLALVIVAVVVIAAALAGLIPDEDPWQTAAVITVAFTASFLGLLTFALIAWIFMSAAINRRRAAALLSYTEQAVRLNLPLPRMFRAIGDSETGALAARMQRATVALEQGEPLAVALESVPQFPPRIIGLLAAAERVGRLPQVLARLMEQRRARVVRGLAWVPFYRTYSLVLIAAFIGMTTMLMIFVVPKFEAIFHDFKLQLPWVTIVTLTVARFSSPWLPVLLLIVLVIAACASVWTRWTGSGFGPAESPLGWILNRLPWIGTVRMQGALGEALEFCAEAIEGGRAIEPSLFEAAAIAPNPIARRKLRNWAVELFNGQSLPAAARSAGLPRLIAGMTATAVQTTDLAQVFHFLGRYYASRFSRTMAMLRGAFIPIVVLFMGFLVAWLALSIFLPMITMIDLLSAPRMRF